MSKTTKLLGFSVPPPLFKEVETLAKAERRTNSERDVDEERWINAIITQVKAQEVQRPTPPFELLKESKRLAREGERQLKNQGLKPKDINRLIHEYRGEKQP